jgi:hypothetical protein
MSHHITYGDYMNKTARFSMGLMLVAGSYMAMNVSAGETDLHDGQHRTGAITEFLGNMVHPEAPTNNDVGVPQFGAPTGHVDPNGVRHGVPFMGHQQDSPTGAPHGSPTGAPHFQQGAQTPCDKGVVPQR